MAAPRDEVVQMSVQNPHATMPLFIPVLVVRNTSDEDIARNIRANAALPLSWIAAAPEHERVAVLCGGGASIEGCLDDIRALVAGGADVFAMNAASRWLRGHAIAVDYQVIADAKPETATLVDTGAARHLFASQVHPDTMAAVMQPTVWHLESGDIEQYFPAERVRRGGYALIGGGATVGNSALCLAYAMGYRDLHVFGYDSCHRGNRSHAYSQPMNRFIPVVDVEWGGKHFRASVAMKAQAEKFQITAQALKQAGCTVTVHGDGLLQAMYTTPPKDLNERDKYRLLWQFDGYRDFSPGEEAVDEFLARVKPSGLIIDFGCGTGRAGLRLAAAGHDVMLVDFADNCRDDEALALPFLEWDLALPCPLQAPYGLCTDVMEHIPTPDVPAVIANILAAAGTVYFNVATRPDKFGEVIHARLHLTVRPHDWWAEQFRAHGAIAWQEERAGASCFIVTRRT